jgi:uncharacterized protein (DUF342 family)
MSLVPVEDRADGVYIKYSRELRDKVKYDLLVKTMEECRVINCDLLILKDVVERARGVFEKISPPFEYYNELVESYVELTITSMQAIMKVTSRAIAENIRLTETILLHMLARKGICFGVKKDIVRQFLAEKIYDTDLIVAEGESAQAGRNGKVDYEIKINPDASPRVLQSGKVDFRDIQSFTAVKEGQVIARYFPPTPGKPGKTVTGDDIPAKSGENILLPAGKNTQASEDGKFLLAGKTGVVYKQGNLVHVEEILHITSNVDFSVGNIKYSGDIYITGNIMPGFTIESEGNIQIRGDVEGAKVISRNGSVTIERGVIGKKDTYIYGKEGVYLDFAQEAEIKTEKTVTVKKYLLHCTCVCANFDATMHNASVVGGVINAYETIRACNLGNDKHIKTKAFVISKLKEQAELKIKELTELKDKITKQLDPIMKEMKSKSAFLRQAKGAISDRNKELLNKIVEQYNNLNTKLQYVEKKIVETQDFIKEPSSYEGFVELTGTVYPGVEIDLYGLGHFDVKTAIVKKIFKLTETSIQQTEGKES